MLLPWLVRSEMKIKDLCPLEKTEKTAQSCGFLRFSLLTFCASLYNNAALNGGVSGQASLLNQRHLEIPEDTSD